MTTGETVTTEGQTPDQSSEEVECPFVDQAEISEEDYLESDTGKLVERIDGRLHILPSPTLHDHLIFQNVFDAFHRFVTAERLGIVLFGPLPIRLREGRYRAPDMMYFAYGTLDPDCDYPDGADLILEVVGPGAECRHRDFVAKRVDYAEAKIPEYWIVDPEMKQVTVLALGTNAYEVHATFQPGDMATSRLLNGFSVSVSMIFDIFNKYPYLAQ